MSDAHAPADPFQLDAASGLVVPSRQVPSPNADARPLAATVDLIVVHAISLPPGEYGGDHIDALFANRLNPAAHPYFGEIASLRVSVHFLIDRAGRLTQFVPVHRRAWHAGESNFRGRTACNDFSIGIELEGIDDGDFEDAQYAVLDALAACLTRAVPTLDDGAAVGHSDIAPGRKRDPGPGFDWARVPSLRRVAASL